jgi:hypothetical protein
MWAMALGLLARNFDGARHDLQANKGKNEAKVTMRSRAETPRKTNTELRFCDG